jgi:Carboxypeptidase regulatory-like domain/TonB dependent receptor-like, beta-barrel
MLRKLVYATTAVCVAYCFMPAAASAQSAITGLVTDTSGAVLPGVTVEAASPALIEKIRTTQTDAEGRYSILNLRPGTYNVTFTLPGFASFAREAMALPSDFTATVNAELRVGSLEETVTVSGEAPVVDVESTQRTTVVSRDLIDSLPSGRTFAAVGALATGVRVSEPNVGGARTATQQRLTAYGSLAKDTTVDVDGMKSNSISAGGDDQADHNDGMTAEFTVQTGGLSAEVARGGPHINLIPREGSNTFSGATYFGYTNGSMQSDNLGDLLSRGLTAPDAVDLLYYSNVAIGGPIKRDRLWFFGSYGNNGNDNIVSNSFYPDGRPGIYDQRIKNYTARLTWQLNAKNKLTVFDDYVTKYLGHDFTSGVDVATASTIRPPKQKYTATVKWTSTLSNRLLLETGFLATANTQGRRYQEGIRKIVGTPEWYATASRQDLNRGTITTAPSIQERTENVHAYLLSSSVSYVTGSHAFKSGVQWNWGPLGWDWRGSNGELTQRYRDGVPDSVTVFNTPTFSRNRLNADLGIYAQDAWQLTSRLTLTPGVRFEYLNASIQAFAAPPGRFVPGREFPAVPDLPNWFNVAPRFGVAYDLTGDAKTALKGTVSRYHRNFTTDLAALYDPLYLQSENRNWSDCDYIPGTSRCSGLALGTNGDNIAQDNEIGPSSNRTFGAAPDRHFDPKSKRPYDLEYTVGIERELGAGMSAAATWFRRESYNLQQTINQLVDVSDYTAFQVPSPLDGEPVTIYNLNPAKQGMVDLLDTTADHSKARFSFQGIELTFKARLPNGGNMLGGWSAGKVVAVECANFSDPNTFRYCDHSELDIPFRHSFRFAASYPLPLGLNFGATALSNAGALLGNEVTNPLLKVTDPSLRVLWNVPANLFPGGRTQPVTVRLNKPGSEYLERWNQLDIEIKRAFTVGKLQVEPGVDVYNVFNGNVVLVQNQNFGSALGQPQRVLQGRLVRLAAQIRF